MVHQLVQTIIIQYSMKDRYNPDTGEIFEQYMQIGDFFKDFTSH